jgi:hypothetical protein
MYQSQTLSKKAVNVSGCTAVDFFPGLPCVFTFMTMAGLYGPFFGFQEKHDPPFNNQAR